MTIIQVGKYQTLGGSIFQIGTVCTIATFDPYDMEMGGGDIGRYLRLTEHVCLCAHIILGYSSRKRSPDGDWNNATGTLTQLDHPGHFSQVKMMMMMMMMMMINRVTSSRSSTSGASRGPLWTTTWFGWTRRAPSSRRIV